MLNNLKYIECMFYYVLPERFNPEYITKMQQNLCQRLNKF